MFQKSPSKPDSEEISKNGQVERSASKPSSEKSSSKPQNASNVILSDVEITGTVRFKNDVVIDGKIDGEVYSDGSITIGREATVNAEIRSKCVIVEGCVKGDIHATERLELGEHAEVTGDIKAAVLSMQAGAVLLGNSAVGAIPMRKEESREERPMERESAIVPADSPKRELAHA